MLTLASLLACSDGAALPPAPVGPSLEALSPSELESFEAPVRRQFEDAYAAWTASADSPASKRAAAAGEWGRLLQAYGRADAAVTAYETASSLAPDAHPWLYLRGAMLQEAGDLEAALPLLRRAADLAPQDVSTHLRVSRSLLGTRQWDDAKAALQKTLELDPQNAMAYYLAGELELSQGEPKVALLALEFALKLQPASNSVHASMARAFEALGDEERAAAHRRQAGPIPLRVEDPLRAGVEALNISSQKDLERAHLMRRVGDTEAALVHYRRAVETAPSNARARSALGAMLAESGDLDGAIEEMRKA
ncbi:MAG: tetratricopeptide repeat protein, partial [Acidobacteriota bacterium]